MTTFIDNGDCISLLGPSLGAIHFGRQHVGAGTGGEPRYPIIIRRTGTGARVPTMIVDAPELRQWCRAVLAALPAEPRVDGEVSP